MFITPHILFGGAMAIQSSGVVAAFFLGLLSHYIADFLPHWDYMNGTKIDSKLWIKIAIDFLLGLTVLSVLLWPLSSFSNKKLFIIIGASAALIPDFLEFLYISFSKFRKNRLLKLFHVLHEKVHYWEDYLFWRGLPAILILILFSVAFIFLNL